MEILGFVLAECNNKPNLTVLKESLQLRIKIHHCVSINKHVYGFAPGKTNEFLTEISESTRKASALLRQMRRAAATASLPAVQ